MVNEYEAACSLVEEIPFYLKVSEKKTSRVITGSRCVCVIYISIQS
jgi:hypothetical protein